MDKKPNFLGKKPKEINNETPITNQSDNSDYIKKYNVFVSEMATKQAKFHLDDTVIIDSKHDKYSDRVGKLMLGGCDADSFRVKLKTGEKVIIKREFITKICKADYNKGK